MGSVYMDGSNKSVIKKKQSMIFVSLFQSKSNSDTEDNSDVWQVWRRFDEALGTQLPSNKFLCSWTWSKGRGGRGFSQHWNVFCWLDKKSQALIDGNLFHILDNTWPICFADFYLGDEFPWTITQGKQLVFKLWWMTNVTFTSLVLDQFF